MTTAAQIMTAARSRLVRRNPFFGSLALRLKIEEHPKASTMATDGEAIYYNPEWVEQLGVPAAAAVIAHEVLHVALCHHLRRGERDPGLWNQACDYAINLTLHDSGMFRELPEEGLLDPQYRGKAADTIYAELERQQQEQPKPQQGQQPGPQGESAPIGSSGGGAQQQPSDGESGGQGQPGEEPGDGQGPGGGAGDGAGEGQGQGGTPKGAPEDPTHCGEVWDATSEDGQALSQGEIKEAERQIAQAVYQAAQAEKSCGTGSSGALRGVLQAHAGGQIDWRDALRAFLKDTLSADFSWSRPNRRFIGGGMYLPSAEVHPTGELVVAIDTSCSVDQDELDMYATEITTIAEEINPREIVVIYCDDKVVHTETFEPGDEIRLQVHGGGGTNFTPPFLWVKAEELDPCALIYFTDGCGRVDHRLTEEPEYPVLWATSASTPRFRGIEQFGEVLAL